MRAILFATLFVVSVGFGIVLPILPHLARELGATPLQIGLLTASYATVQFLVAPSWGRLSDRHGRKPILIIGLIGLTASFFIMSLATNYTWLLIGRVLGGFLAAATIPTAQALAADLSRPHERAGAMGAVGAAISLGFIFGPTIGGALIPIGMAAPFWAGAIVTAITVAFAFFVLKEPDRDKERASSLSLPRGRLALITSALRGHTGHLCIIVAAITFGQSTVMTLLTLYLIDRFGATAAHAGLAFGLQSTVSLVLQVVAVSRLVHRLGEGRTVLLSLVVGCVGFVSLTAAPSLTWAIGSLAFTTFAMSLGRPAAGSALSKSAGGQQGLIMGILASFESAGRAFGPLFAGFAYGKAPQLPFVSVVALYLIVLAFTARRLWHTMLPGEEADYVLGETAQEDVSSPAADVPSKSAGA